MASHGDSHSADHTDAGSIFKSVPGYKPILLLIAAIVFSVIVILPPTKGMIDLVSKETPAGYNLPNDCKTITDAVNKKLRSEAFMAAKKGESAIKKTAGEDGWHDAPKLLLNQIEVARLVKITVAILLLAAFLWGTEALSLGATDILVGMLLYLFAVLPMNEISKAYMTDAVFFIFGIFVVSVGVAKTGLDKRIGLILLSKIKSTKAFAFIFIPMLAIADGFLPEHALVGLLIPVLLGVYKVSCKMHGVKKDMALAVFLLLGICFASNHGSPGSPAAGGKNGIMVSYLVEYDVPISFLQWIKFGFPFVLLMSVVIGAYMYLRLKPKFQVPDINPSEVVQSELARMPKISGKELAMAIILVLLLLAWIITGEHGGLGGPTLCAMVAMFLCRIIRWKDVQEGVAFDVIGLYAAACAIGTALKFTGGALWLANSIFGLLPDFLTKGDGLLVGVSILTGIITNFMSDGSTVAVLGPIVLPMAALAQVSLWKVGLITSFSSSFGNFLIVASPNNAICFAMGRDPDTGEKLLTAKDFFKHGIMITILAWLVTWVWVIFGYWRFMYFPH